ncbi:hypothetical protein [Aquabacterium humicola]|uniref:hypothetical protein n=1 Tax=Aquabacterium humicola TaxID=3237377 RepID=UPI0025436AF6|nr:hypothetical protein [Rubrivivax pictus]
MDSILLTELDKRIRTSPDSVSWARDVLRAASHFARQGQVDVALKWMDSVKQHFGNRIDPEVACWLMLAEGMLQYFQLRWQDAHDRFRGAYGTAVTFAAARARPCCAAWMSHIEFNEGRYDSMIRFIGEAWSTAAPDDHQTRARAALVMACAQHYASSFKQARSWYERTRWHATAEGDGATMSSLMHNMAAFRTASVCMSDAFGSASPAETQQALMEASSAASYDLATGSASYHRATIPLIRAQLLGVQGKFDDALVILTTIDAQRLPPRQRLIIAIERARCLAKLDLREHVDQFVQEATGPEQARLEDDDAAYVYARLAEIEALTDRRYVDDSLSRANAAMRRHREVQTALEGQLIELESRLHLPPLAKAED